MIDIGNAYLNAPTEEKVYAIAGDELDTANIGKPVIIVRALYGLKSSGASWRNHLAETISSMNFESSLGDQDVWMQAAMKGNGDMYYKYLLCYVDNILIISLDTEKY